MESDALAAAATPAGETDDGEGVTSQLSPLADVEITFEECELLEMNALCLPSHPQLIYARGTGLARKYPKSQPPSIYDSCARSIRDPKIAFARIRVCMKYVTFYCRMRACNIITLATSLSTA